MPFILRMFLIIGLLGGYSLGKEGEPFRGTKTKSQLVGRAVLNAATFSRGPTSGRRLGTGPINGQEIPWVNRQPIQGFSAILANHDATFWVMSDNGFGTLANSADYRLRVYKIRPHFKTARGGNGKILVEAFIELHDPDKYIPFAITNHFTRERFLTGADFDIESMQRDHDGTFWFGDEFGPFLLHTDQRGKLLEPPVALPDLEHPGKEIRSPEHPFYEESNVLRVMNAIAGHARQYGDKQPVFSPWFLLLDDGDSTTYVESRKNPPVGFPEAASDIFKVKLLQEAGYPVVVWTVNDTADMKRLIALGVNGIISDRPDLLRAVLENYDPDNDGLPDLLDADGCIDRQRFDAQGHRGGRNLRPENTLPAMEAALDHLMTTLETDCGITADEVPLLNHDPYIMAAKVRRADGKPYRDKNEMLLRKLTLKEIQSTFIADKLLKNRPKQTHKRSLSPVTEAFSKENQLNDPYIMPSLQQLFDFVKFYTEYYRSGAGKVHLDAVKRWKNARKVRFNIETKVNPREDLDAKRRKFVDRTREREPFARAIAEVIIRNGMEERADIQSFEFGNLLYIQKNYPQIRTVCLFGDFPKQNGKDDGTNLQDENGRNTPWLGGLLWPYRVTRANYPCRIKSSAGFEGMAIDYTGRHLLPLLEKPLLDGEPGTLLIHEFNLRNRSYTGIRFKYPLNERATAIGDFVMFSRRRGVVIERDDSAGDMSGFKAIYEIELKGAERYVSKRLAVDLLNIADPNQLSRPFRSGDVGVGETFGCPFVTIENILIFNKDNIGILNDNNYPFSIGRHVGDGWPDDNEFIILRLSRSLGEAELKTNFQGDGSIMDVPKALPPDRNEHIKQP